jgi:hypothetical protein
MQYGSISASQRRDVGAMTAHMRALASGPRCLRVALVLDCRIVRELRLGSGARLTIGRSEHADLLIPGARVPARCVLFEPSGDRHRLLPPRECHGRVLLDEGVLDIGSDAIELDDHAKGKLEIGGAVVLFQVVPEPPARARPVLPRAVLEPVVRVDWNTTLVAAFSFLLHFLLAGALYSDWLDPVLDEGVTVNGVVDDIRALPPAPEVVPDSVAESATVAAPPTRERAAPQGRGAGSKRGGPSGASAGGSAALARQLAALELETLGVLKSGGPATAGVLRHGEVPTAALDAAAASDKGVSAPGQIAVVGGGPIARGSNDLSAIGRRDVAGVHDTGRATRVDGPKPVVGSSPPTVHGTVSDAARVVASMRAGFRACYQKAILDSPDAQGRIQLRVNVGPNGEVTGVAASPSGNLPGSMVSCVRSRASMAQFGPPEGGMAIVQVPVWFVQN